MALDNQSAFKEPYDAYERRGYVKGIQKAKALVDSLYEETHSTKLKEEEKLDVNHSEAGSGESGRFVTIDAGTNPADESDGKFAY